MLSKMIFVPVAALAVAGIAGAQEADQAYAAAGAVDRNYPVGGFDSVSSAGAHKVVVTVGGRASVRASGPADVLDRLEVVVEDGDLEIRPKREYRNRDWRDRRGATFYVSAPSLKAASLAGSGDMSVDRVVSDRFSASVAGSGNLSLGSIRADQASFSIAGSGDVSGRGSVGRSEVSIAGSGNARLREVAARQVSVSIAGSGNADLTAAERVSASIVGSGDVDVAGTARCSVSKMGSGTLRCGS